MHNLNLLIDTQSFIWFVENNPKLPEFVRHIMEDEKYNLFISMASLWEIVIKSSLGKLELKKDISDVINNVDNSGFSILHITTQHLITLHGLEYCHKDPFDRIIISQAITEKMPIISSDVNIDKYKVVVMK